MAKEMKRAGTAVVCGGAMIDVIAVVAASDIEQARSREDGAPYLKVVPGRKIPAQSIESHVGGGGCNVSVSLARQGWRAAVLGKTGEDLHGEAVRAHLEREGVDRGLLLSSPEAGTGVSVMIAAHDRNAALFVHRGANETLTEEDVAAVEIGSPDLFYVAPLSSGSADQFGALLAKGRASGAFTAANPGVRQLSSRAGALLDALAHLDLLSLNRLEAETLAPALFAEPAPAEEPADAPALLREGLSTSVGDVGLRAFCKAVRARGPSWALVTDGTEGAYLAGPSGLYFCPPAPARVEGTAGAGDAFCSTLTAALAVGEPPESALRRAAVNAASVVSRVNTTDGLLSAEALSARVDGVSIDPVKL